MGQWVAFRGLFTPAVPLEGITGGVHYFIVCIHDDGTPINLIPHKYLIDPDGGIGADNFGGLTRDERLDASWLMTAHEHGPDERKRLSEMREKSGPAFWPPLESIEPLNAGLPKQPRAGSAAAVSLTVWQNQTR